uniref:Protein kinase domain-containing protein n=1 Tax=Sus scrofa TaxID=9823 RepID=A0A4X1T9N9_PIG
GRLPWLPSASQSGAPAPAVARRPPLGAEGGAGLWGRGWLPVRGRGCDFGAYLCQAEGHGAVLHLGPHRGGRSWQLFQGQARGDWRDRGPQEGGPTAAGGWHPHQALREVKALQEIEDSQYDLKPANLLISASRQLKIADFGLAWGLFPRWLPPLHAPGGHQEMTTTTRSPSRSRCPCPWRRCCWMPLPRLWSFWGGSSSTLHSSALQPPR